MPGVLERNISETPITVIDFETTGLNPGADRVVEMTAVRCDPGEKPRVVLNTLINPMRKMSATEIHGITDEDVEDAPIFNEVAGNLVEAIAGSVVAAYNVYFDIKFLRYELEQAGIRVETPHMCLMYMRPLLGLGPRCKLVAACDAHNVPYQQSHIAVHDAEATATLLHIYMKVMDGKGVRTFGDLKKRKSYKFMQSFAFEPLPKPKFLGVTPNARLLLQRSEQEVEAPDPTMIAIRSYWDTIKVIVTDLQVTDEELEHAVNERKRLGLAKEQIRFIHARAFAMVVAQFIDDQHLDDKEVVKLRKLYAALARLGWAPGQ
ncbi:MAG: 3'-5' exonuclease [Planctomycetes bacterium]|nr:3'-5' exonuclease [Planctomycetota bacterium]